MHSTLIRAQNVFGFFTTVIFILSGLIASSVLFFPQSPSASINLRNIQVVRGRAHYYSTQKSEYAHIKFDLEADLSSLFNWNTKQVFLYVLASWPSPSSSSSSISNSSSSSTITKNEAIIWDMIIPAIEPTTKNGKKKQQQQAQPPQQKQKTKGILNLRNQKPKYQITDPSGHIAERGNVSLSVGYNIQPWVGGLIWGGGSIDGIDVQGEGKSRRKGWWGWRWQGLKGGRSERFAFPSLKSKKDHAGGGAGGK